MNEERYQRVSELFQAAVQLPEDERASLLHQACAGDEELRAEVESMLACDSPETEPIGASERGHALEAALHTNGLTASYTFYGIFSR